VRGGAGTVGGRMRSGTASNPASIMGSAYPADLRGATAAAPSRRPQRRPPRCGGCPLGKARPGSGPQAGADGTTPRVRDESVPDLPTRAADGPLLAPNRYLWQAQA